MSSRKPVHKLTPQGKRKRIKKMAPNTITLDNDFPINPTFHNLHNLEVSNDDIVLPGSYDKERHTTKTGGLDSSKSSPTCFPDLNETAPKPTTSPPRDSIHDIQSVFEILDKCVVEDSDDSGVNDDFLKESESQRLQRDIRNWSVQFAITHVALSALLTILKAHDCFKALPLDARTLKDTPTSTQLNPVDPGHYCHIGIGSLLSQKNMDKGC